MGHTFTNLLVHMIFSTKDRLPLVDVELRSKLYPYLGGILNHLGAIPLALNGPADHVHGLVKLRAVHSVAKVVEKLKSNSTGWVHEEWPERRQFAWQEGYAAFSVSESCVPALLKYIAGQE
ncbi:MAG: IS200/IS605 family transposase, partial [Acidobacteriia bacterium]|nr:IS200/IS605 family transposase [Terriglobia bacterium]